MPLVPPPVRHVPPPPSLSQLRSAGGWHYVEQGAPNSHVDASQSGALPSLPAQALTAVEPWQIQHMQGAEGLVG
jgi:hypothetical protein